MARKQQRASVNSVARQVQAMQNAASPFIAPPEGVILADDELILWEQFTKARAREDWRDLDLILLAKVVQIEADVRKYREQWRAQGAVIDNSRGTPVENPLLRVIDTLTRQQMAVIRSISLTQLPSDARTINGAAKADAAARKTLDEVGAVGLLKLPARH